MPRAKNPRNSNVSSNQVITMPEVTSTPQIRKTAFPANPAPPELEGQIRQRAYELYQERGCTPGQENDDWFRAEREVLARNGHRRGASA